MKMFSIEFEHFSSFILNSFAFIMDQQCFLSKLNVWERIRQKITI